MSLGTPSGEFQNIQGRDWVVGLDVSLTSTGVAIIGDGGFRTGRVLSKGTKGDSLADRHFRLARLRDEINRLVPADALVVIEQPSYGSTTGSHHDRSGLWWMVVNAVLFWGHPIAEVAPATLKRAATGKGNAAKDQVLAAVVKRYPDADVTDNNIADAVVLAALGSRHLGRPVEADTQFLKEAVAKVRWPEVAA